MSAMKSSLGGSCIALGMSLERNGGQWETVIQVKRIRRERVGGA